MDGTSVNTGHAVSKKSQVKLSLNVKFFCYTYKLVHELEMKYEILYHKL